ncbi:MAG: tetratricopeptide repeat protein [Bacteroides sp.]|nr:tetratricopeptide repeat protein [Roseburia sp.]MCM1346509.1 tetratricopeptide repeat protein [Bacteroides sp.]MCM1421061.1 tetratricopeptide repeat protein [Bacteroides sp.]
MDKKNYLLLPAASALLLVSCSKMGQFSSDDFTVTPTPLEYVAGEVPATISASVPAKFMNKKAVVTCIPVLKWDGGQKVGASATFQGEKVEANNQVISYKNGGHATMRTSFPYEDGMEKSELWMTFDAKKGKKTVKLPEVKIGYGVNSTSALVAKAVKTGNNGVASDNFSRVINQKQAATIKFLISQANLRGSELNSQNVKDFIETLKNIKSDEESLVLNNIEISAYASPDGRYSFNEKLAEKRGQTSEGFVNQQLKKTKLTTDVDTKYTAEDWEGFQELVSQSNLKDKDLILRVLSMYTDPEQREQEIKNVATVYKELADAVMPELRRARMIINYDVIGRSDEEILSTFSETPNKLSVEELIYAGNVLATSDAQKEAIFKKTAEIYPKDFRAYNNLADIAMRQGDNETAQNYLRKALSLDSNAAEANTNLGLIALQNGSIKDAEVYLAKGASSKNTDEALGNLYIAQGKYNLAASKLQNVNTNSAALSQILSQDYASAKSSLDKISNADATTYYLKAVLAARMNNKGDVAANLSKAISLDSSYAKRAANDVEFTNFAAVIKDLVK